jgi:UDP-2,3-diacylglucosamine hydrolase
MALKKIWLSPLSPMHHKLQDGAIFIADAHYQVGVRESFSNFLQKIQTQEIKTKQLIMIGDMFDLLVGSIDYTLKENQQIIQQINHLSKECEILYFEGNHDFDLQKIFPKVKVIPLKNQPLYTLYHDKSIALAHGDVYHGVAYKLYTIMIRNPFVLKILNFIDKNANNFISKKILLSQKKKNICKKIENFSQIIKQKSKKYDIAGNGFDVICEGHYHMDEEFSLEGATYKLFASYACDRCYFSIDFKDSLKFSKHTL